MFDGAEGGAGAGEGGPGMGAPGTEDLAEPRVEYGKAEAGSEGDNEPDAPENGNQGSDLDAEFEELINGKYKEQFGGRVNGIMQNRFKNAQDYQAQVGEWSDATAILAAKYGIDNTPEALKKAIENDDGMFNEAAEAEGLTAEKYRENLRLKMDAQAGRTLQEHMAAEAEKQARFDQWDAEAEELKGAFPAFDLDAELENEVFTQSLVERLVLSELDRLTAILRDRMLLTELVVVELRFSIFDKIV